MENRKIFEQEIEKRLNNALWDKQVAYNIDKKLSQKKGFLSFLFAVPILLSVIAFFIVQNSVEVPTEEEIDSMMIFSDINFLVIEYDPE